MHKVQFRTVVYNHTFDNVHFAVSFLSKEDEFMEEMLLYDAI